ncbi:crotonase/enoyl-CoA hydratase family protein [Oharaeibacter diazotrophicus]|uniref:DSF synthase n=1 Tax=Oharaeibacter diazotrophicus TaxID=1920512 RepID=A0A4R6R9K7_9HYPH|nr:crotonase/enoyl-CoA hydratase family protein [Oharaeibacter diazotrophicus]TDP82750.1 DSF synthase [Oharaeibacter diazotrophicus]BBE72488.1 putative enoyl-CoA hydratase echA8 [Pleomorphomonas sp. SM30]GLS76519.1 hypothetical protein GCM10007904_18560 [Oharaeibacter diazotrophicus]
MTDARTFDAPIGQRTAAAATERELPRPRSDERRPDPIWTATAPGAVDELTRFLSRSYQELDVRLDPNTRALWCHMRPAGPPSFTPGMVRELIQLHRAIQGLMASQPPGEEPLIRYYVQGSRIPGIYNMGGDLAFLTRAIRAGDRTAVRRYAFDCVDAVYHIAIGFDSGIVSVGLLQGDALGGGFEGALCCNVLIAERSVKLGLPEILFNSFPGMGAYSFLARRLDAARAERMILSGRIYTAEEMHAMGIVDEVVDDGAGEAAVSAYLRDRQSHVVRSTLYKVRQRVAPISLAELRDVTDLWVDAIMRLAPADLRRMEHLQQAQGRRLQKTTAS